MILRIQASAALAIFVTLSAAATVLPNSAQAGPSASQTVAAQSTGPSGTLAGTVLDGHGRPLAGVCVTATPTIPREDSAAASRTALTSDGGTFMITGLPVGAYLLRYRRCLSPAGKPVGALATRPVSSRAYVTSGHITTLEPMRLRPRRTGQAAEMPTRPALTRLTVAQSRRRFSTPSAAQNLGGVAGTVLGPHGRHIKGLCWSVFFDGGSYGGPIGANGRYSTGKNIPQGTYTVGFSASCGFPFGPSANWAPEWYRGQFRQSAANSVVIKAGQITRGIDGTMRPGGVISGIVTGHNGHGVSGVCVVAVTPNGSFVQQVTTPRNGGYRFQGLDPGRYGIGFFPHCGEASVYLPQWWPGRASETKQGLIKTGFGTTRNHIDAKLVLGGTISGVIRFRTRHGRPIKGMCVDAMPVGQLFNDFSANTNAKGEYAIRGLPAGRYMLFFSPGCDNNGNYLSQSYPRNVTVRLGHVTGNIDAFLQPGAIVTGTVTAKSTGAKLAGICVSAGDSEAETDASGIYAMNQITPGTIQVQFFNCGNRGNFAPQFYPGRLNADAAASIKVRGGQVVSGINAALTPGATISGAISLASGRKLSNVCVDALPTAISVDLGGNGTQSQRGRYTIEDLAPGEYQIQFSSCGGPKIADSWFKEPGKATFDETKADQIDVPAGASVGSIDAVLRLGGYISGWMFGPAKQQGTLVCPVFTDPRTGDFLSEGFPVPIGDGYTIFGFAPGRYLVEFFPCSGQNLAIQWYKRADRPGRATPILVRAGRTTSNVDAWMVTGGSITGRVVSKATGKPLAGVCVSAISVNQPFGGFGATDRSGDYIVTGLNSSTYRLYFTSCGRLHVTPLVSRALRATQGKTVAGPRVAVGTYQPGAISGQVAVAGTPQVSAKGACVEVLSMNGGFLGSIEGALTTVGRGGNFLITGLVPGRYKVLINAPFCQTDTNLVPQWYLNASRMSKATVVTVAPGRTTRLTRVLLRQDGSLSGTVTGPKPADKPLAGICVQVLPVAPNATPFLAESIAPAGHYLIDQLPPGRYRVEFEADCVTRGYATQWWNGAPSMSTATPVTVPADQTRSGIDATLTPAG